MTARLTVEDVGTYLRAASAGDSKAWDRIVSSYVGLVWSIARQHGLNSADSGDVSQTVWLRLVENVDRIEDPTRLGSWLATTTRRECLRVLARGHRQVPVADAGELIDLRTPDSPALDAGLLERERAQQVHAALAQLPLRCQHLLLLLMQDPPPSYEVISATLDVPIGSIGPTRGRCLRRLQQLLQQNESGPETSIAKGPSVVLDGDG